MVKGAGRASGAGSGCGRRLAGLLFIVIGVVLIRHPHLTVALIGLFVGFTWVLPG